MSSNVAACARAFRVELYRAVRGKLMLALASLPFAIAGIRVLIAHLSDVADRSRKAGEALQSGEAAEFVDTVANAYGPFVDGFRMALALGIVLLLAATSTLIASDREAGTIRMPLTRSVSRTHLALAKLAIALLMALVVIASAALGAWSFASFFFDFGPYIEDDFEIYTEGEIREEIWLGLKLLLPSFLATTWFGVAVSSLARTGGQAISISLASYVFLDLFKGLLGSTERFLFTYNNPSVNDRSYLAEAAKVARGYSDFGFDEEMIQLAQVAPLPQALFFAALTVLIILRRKM